jgi:hypothetical protein
MLKDEITKNEKKTKKTPPKSTKQTRGPGDETRKTSYNAN